MLICFESTDVLETISLVFKASSLFMKVVCSCSPGAFPDILLADGPSRNGGVAILVSEKRCTPLTP
jgi:hypothetical protein